MDHNKEAFLAVVLQVDLHLIVTSTFYYYTRIVDIEKYSSMSSVDAHLAQVHVVTAIGLGAAAYGAFVQ